jgi:cytochrome c biogenesis protein CcmG, thiol:disulfide interchange protein DsbE
VKGSARDTLRRYGPLGALLVGAMLFGALVLPRLSPVGPRVGAALEEISLPIVVGGNDGDRFSLRALRGHVVVLEFWASWCKVCSQQLPIMQRLSRAQLSNVAVVSVNEGDSLAVIAKSPAGQGGSMLVVSDLEGDIAERLSVSALPTVVVVDREGKVSSVTSGLIPYGRLLRLVEDALGR